MLRLAISGLEDVVVMAPLRVIRGRSRLAGSRVGLLALLRVVDLRSTLSR